MFSSFQLRKTSVLLSREAQHAHSVHAGGGLWLQVDFVLQEGDGGEALEMVSRG